MRGDQVGNHGLGVAGGVERLLEQFAGAVGRVHGRLTVYTLG
jgi:hypothetical protein